MTRYLSGLCVAGLGLCAGGWLVVAAVAFGGPGGEAGRVNVATGTGLILTACVTGVAWALAWRRRMRADGVFGDQFLLVSPRQARRNRRELARDIRRTARQSKREARRAKSDADQPGPPADDEFLPEPAYLGITVYEHGPDGRALSREEPVASGASSTGTNGTGFTGTDLTVTGPTGSPHDGHQGGHDGASAVGAADVLGELRTLRILLAPLLAGAGAGPEPRTRSRPQQEVPPGLDQAERPEPRERQERSRPAVGSVAGDEEMLRAADSEEAWW